MGAARRAAAGLPATPPVQLSTCGARPSGRRSPGQSPAAGAAARGRGGRCRRLSAWPGGPAPPWRPRSAPKRATGRCGGAHWRTGAPRGSLALGPPRSAGAAWPPSAPPAAGRGRRGCPPSRSETFSAGPASPSSSAPWFAACAAGGASADSSGTALRGRGPRCPTHWQGPPASATLSSARRPSSPPAAPARVLASAAPHRARVAAQVAS